MSDDRSNISPLPGNQKIVNSDGTPTLFMTRWAQARSIDISAGITVDQATALIDQWAANRKVIAGTGLIGGGDLSSDVTLNLANTAVAPGTYGDATHVGQFTVNAQGRLTAAANVAISGGGGGSHPWYWAPPTASMFPTVQVPSGQTVTIADDADVGLLVTAPQTGNNTPAFYYKPFTTPAADWQLDFHMEFTCVTGSSVTSECGVWLVNAAKTIGFILGYDARQEAASGAFNIPTGFRGTQVLTVIAGGQPGFYRAIYVSATGTLTFFFSRNGKSYMLLSTIAVDTALGSKPSFVGPGLATSSSGAVGTASGIFDRWVQTGAAW